MQLCQARRGRQRFAWDPARLDEPRAGLFDPAWWRARDALDGQALGRGAAYFVEGLDGAPWVLRHNRRGGALARINHDRYLWTGEQRLRPLAELRLLARLTAWQLPVPAPVAARAIRRGPWYRGDIIMSRLLDAVPLADHLLGHGMSAAAWRALGATLAGFHEHGVWHGDLNARNVLCGPDSVFYLIDFDKASIREPGRWCAANLARLRRSLDKIAGLDAGVVFAAGDWDALRAGYDRVFARRL